MKKNYTYIFFLLILAHFFIIRQSLAQNELDLQDTEKKIQGSSGNEKANLLLYYSKEIGKIDLVKGITLTEDALRIAQTSQDKKLLAQCFNQLGYFYFLNDKFLQANSYCQQAKTIFQETGNKNDYIDALNNLTEIANASNNPQAQDFNNEAMKLAQDHNYQKGLSVAYANNAKIKGKSNTDILQSYLKAVEIAESISDKSLLVKLYNEIGTHYRSVDQNIDKAIEYYQKELQKRAEVRDNISIVENLNRLAYLHSEKKFDYYTALDYFFQAFVTEQSYPIYQKNETFVETLKGIIDCYRKLKERHPQAQEKDKALAYQKLEQAYQNILNQFQQSGKNIQNYNNTQQNTIVQTVYTDNQKTRLLEITNEKLRLDQLAKDKQIGILEEAKQKAMLQTQEDGIKILNQDKLIASLQEEKMKQKNTIDSLHQYIEKEGKSAGNEGNSWFWIILLGSLLLVAFLYVLYVNRSKETAIKEMMQNHTNKLKMYGEENYKQTIKIKEQDKQIQELSQLTTSIEAQKMLNERGDTDPTIENEKLAYVLVDLPMPELNEDEKDILKPYIPRLNQFAYYETGSIKKLITEIDTKGNSNLDEWKSQVESAILRLDENKYKQLITV